MKLTNHLRLAAAMLIIASAFMLQSCLDDDDDETFSVTVSGFVLQDTDSTTLERTFAPYFFVTTNNTSFFLQDVTMQQYGGDLELEMLEYNILQYYSDPEANKTTDLSDLTGMWYIRVTATTGNVYAMTLTMPFSKTDTISNVEVTDLEYSSAGRLTATIKEIELSESASLTDLVIGFAITPYDSSTPLSLLNTSFWSAVESPIFTGGELSFNITFSAVSNLDADKAEVRVFVYHNGIYRLSDVVRTLTNNASVFDEGNYTAEDDDSSDDTSDDDTSTDDTDTDTDTEE